MPVKPDYIKEIGRKIEKEYPRLVTDNFEENKEVVSEVTNVESKAVRNRIEGYIVQNDESEDCPSPEE